MEKKIYILDSTLRDGAQAAGISFSIEDKLKIAKILDDFGVPFIEAGNPGSNPKDMEFFERAKASGFLKNSKLVAFGSTRRRGISANEDKNVRSLLSAETEAVSIFGKSWDFHVTKIIKAELDENLEMIADTISFLKKNGRTVIFDAEHFFDGYKANADYAVKTLKAATEAGADCLCLCDTNGGSFPTKIFEITKKVQELLPVQIGIHCHNDGAMAVAGTISAVEAGARHVQGTFIGFGERTGNTALTSVIPNLQLKLGYQCVEPEKLRNLSATARFVAEISNISLYERQPFVGRFAFAHKGGMHIDGVTKAVSSFEHIDPKAVGNERHILTSEVAGRGAILSKIQKIYPQAKKDSPETARITARLKELEHEGYQFEAAESAFELVVRKQLGKYKPFFELVNFKIIGEQPYSDGKSASAVIKVIVDGKEEITASEGEGPVNALDKALRKALEVFYPQLAEVTLIDYKVRVLDGNAATAAKVRVLIESSDGKSSWTTVGVSNDIIEASWIALVDSIEYKLIRDIEDKFKTYL